MIRQRIMSRVDIAKAMLDVDVGPSETISRAMMLHMIADGKTVRIVEDAAMGGTVVEIDN